MIGRPKRKEGESAMIAAPESLRRRLEQERTRLLQELAQLGRQAGPIGDRQAIDQTGYSNHMADEATQTFEMGKDLALERNLRGLLQQVEQALQRMDEGSYGVCEECGGPIGLERLEAVPWANLCVNCRSRLERMRSAR